MHFPFFKSRRIVCNSRFFGELNDYLFPATAKKETKIWENFTAQQISAEPSLFSADLPYAYFKGGPITSRVLQEMRKLPDVWAVFTGKVTDHHIIIDSRVHSLEKGDYPAIPGWHTDFAERTMSSSMQPDYFKITPTVKVYIVNLSDQEKGVSNTEIIVEPIKLNIPKENVYQSLDNQINKLKPKKIKVCDGEIIGMDQLSLHRATKTHQSGVRFFLRLAILHNLSTTILQTTPQNEVRNQLHIYKEMPKQQSVLPPSLTFSSILNYINPRHPLKNIKEEPILINANFNFAYSKAGSITLDFLNRIKDHPMIGENHNCVLINTRIHMLMKGQYPDLSGWKTSSPFEEDSVTNKNLKSHHFIAFVSNKANGVCFSEIQDEKGLIILKDGQLIHFPDGTPHRCLEAHHFGWRIAMVATVYKESVYNHVQNKIGHQLPIYLDTINLGW